MYSYGFATIASAIPAYAKRGDVIFADKGINIIFLRFLNYYNNVEAKLNFWTINYKVLSESARDILLPGNRKHRQIGSQGIFGLELNMFISSYNSNLNSWDLLTFLFLLAILLIH